VRQAVQAQEQALLQRPGDACRRLYCAVYPSLPAAAVQHVSLLLGTVTACVAEMAKVGGVQAGMRQPATGLPPELLRPRPCRPPTATHPGVQEHAHLAEGARQHL
jgi:hypothetical protein